MSIYAIGDIHGCYTALITLFAQLPRTSDDQYIFLGDYVDKGSDSQGTLKWLIEFSKNNPCTFIRGNHDILMMEACT